MVQPILGWKYIPQDEASWSHMQNYLQRKSYADVFETSEKIMHFTSSSGLQKAEAQLIQAIALKEMGYLNLALEKFFRLIREFPGTQVSYLSLVQVDSLIQQIPYNVEEFQALFNRGAFKDVPESTVSMISYFTALDNMAKNYPSWVPDHLARINTKSFWYFQLQYFHAVSLVKDKKLQKAEEAFAELESKEGAPETIKENSALQRARLLVTRFQFEEADKIYSKSNFLGRNHGRILFEKAFVSYKLKDYSTALGILKSLKAPFFETAPNPEQDLLTMMIYRDLCYYEAVKKINADFENRYKDLLTYLKKGKPAQGSLQLMKMALQHAPLKNYADVVDRVRKENRLLSADTNIPSSLKKEYKKILEASESRAQDKLRFPLDSSLSALANQVVDVSENLKLLSYVSGLDQYRLKTNYESRDYKSEAIELIAFNKLYWPVTTEYWWDEFPNYRVLLADRCEANSKGSKK